MLLVKAFVYELVMKMTSVRMERAFSRKNTAKKSESGVGKGKRENEYRHPERYNSVKLETALNGEYSEGVSQEHRAGISHENTSRIKVERKKAHTCADKYSYHAYDVYIRVGAKQGEKKRCRRNGRNSAGQAVKSVNKVYCVCYGGYPDNRHHRRKYTKLDCIS